MNDNDTKILDPIKDVTWKFWLDTAKHNTNIFKQAFSNIPSDDIATLDAMEKTPQPVVNTNLHHLLRELSGHLVEFPQKFLHSMDLTPGMSDAERIADIDTFT